ncbi:MAG: hypothetical protein WAX29_01490 [Propionibacterium sp.]
MTVKVKEQDLAVFGGSGSGKTVLLSSFFGASQEPSFASESLYKVNADDTGQGTRLLQNYLKMKNTAQAPVTNRFAATRYSFTLKPNVHDDAKHGKSSSFSALRLVWHDYPGEWFEEEPSSEEEAVRRLDTFTRLLKSNVALILVDGQKLLDHAGEEEKYLKSLLWGIRGGLEKLKDEIIPGGQRLKEFPRIWVLALSKADLHPELDVHGFKELIVEKSADDVTALRETLKGFVETPEALSLGEDFLLLSSAKFEPGGQIKVAERVGLDLIVPVASVLPLERLAQWADKLDMPLKFLAPLIDNAAELSAVADLPGVIWAAKLLGKVPRVGPVLGRFALPAMLCGASLGIAKLQKILDQAIADKDYLTAIVVKFRIDLQRGVQDNLLVRSEW